MFDAKATDIDLEWTRGFARRFVWSSATRIVIVLAVIALFCSATQGLQQALLPGCAAIVSLAGTGLGEQTGLVFRSSLAVRRVGIGLVALSVICAPGVAAMRYGDMSKQTGLAALSGVFLMFFWNSFAVVSKFSHLSEGELEIINADPTRLRHPFW